MKIEPVTVIILSPIFLLFQLKFRASEVHVPDIPGAFTTFKAKDVPLFVDNEIFMQESHYHFGKIMGYDKPLNLYWDKDKEEDKQKNKEQ